MKLHITTSDAGVRHALMLSYAKFPSARQRFRKMLAASIEAGVELRVMILGSRPPERPYKPGTAFSATSYEAPEFVHYLRQLPDHIVIPHPRGKGYEIVFNRQQPTPP